MARILIIDDDADVRDHVATTLSSSYYETYTAVDGQDGVNKALALLPDLILCDMLMPILNGQEVLALLRQHPKTESIPFIFLTAVDSRDAVRDSMNLGADDYLFKPFQIGDLLKAISARLKHHEKIIASAEQQIEVIKQRLTHTVTHELRTPVGLLLGSLQMLEWQDDKALSQDTRDMIATMSSGATRLAHVVEQMVFATHLTTGVYSAETVASNGLIVDIGELIHAAHKLAHHFTIRRPENVEVKVIELKDTLTVKAEPGALKQALAEVISNAIAYSPRDGKVRINYRRFENDVRITITDNGQGIESAQVKEAMTWFGQINRETQEQQGMGMGLPLASQLVAIHGGELEINSIIGKGTQAVITLPLVDVD